jgi:hypothetical protein
MSNGTGADVRGVNAASGTGADVRAAIFILTQNNDVRKTYLKSTLYFLFKYFNAAYRYPVVIFHEGDYDARAQREILVGVRASCRDLVRFHTLDAEDFQVPAHVDADKMARCVALKVVPYWRNVRYRLMCRWWVHHVWKYAAGYDYIMRLDDDSFIEEPIERDLFRLCADANIAYASNMVSVDCALCNHGFKELLETMYPAKKEQVASMFQAQQLPMRNARFHPFRSLLSITESPPPAVSETMQVFGMVYYYNNFFIAQTAFWRRADVQSALQAIDESGLMYYKRLGDAPIHTAVALLHARPEQIQRIVFQYSKYMQRGAFVDDNGEAHAYMPDTYADAPVPASPAPQAPPA